jgi:DNA-binding transcriptional LysR family regulator
MSQFSVTATCHLANDRDGACDRQAAQIVPPRSPIVKLKNFRPCIGKSNIIGAIMNLTLRQIRYFIAAAEAGQMSMAARELNVSQSAVTIAILQLEEALRVSLFDRRPGGVRLTAEGSRFLGRARNVMAAVDDAIHSPLRENVSEAGSVRIGVTYTVGGYFLPRHHARFRQAYPNIEVELLEMPRRQLEEALVGGAIDMAVMLVSNLSNGRDIAFETLLRSRRRLWLPAGHELLSMPRIGLADVAARDMIMLTVDEADRTASLYWERSGQTPRVLFATSSVEAVRSMVAAGMGVTILSDMVYRHWSLEGQTIERRDLEDDIPTMDVGVAWPRKRRPKGAALTFLEHLAVASAGGHETGN